MTRAGREVEKIVASLEKLISGDLLEIKSPDWIFDENTKKKREVDISIKGSIGSHSILVIIECRDQTQTQDVTWIEQLVTKKRGIKADRMIALSTSDFTTGAKDLAEKKGIELRLLKDFDPSEVITWLNKISFTFNEQRFEITNVKIRLKEAENRDTINPKSLTKPKSIEQITMQTQDPIFLSPITGKRFSVSNLLLLANEQNNNYLWADILPNKKREEKQFSLSFADKDNILLIEINKQIHRVVEIDIIAKFYKILKSIPVTKARRYTSDNGEIYAERADYEFLTVEGKEGLFTVEHDIKSKKGYLSLQINEKK